MTSRTLVLALLTAAVTFSGAAHADTGLTRDQVKAELAQAQRNGDLIDYETGQKLNQLFPSAYTARSVNHDALAAVDTLPATSAGVAPARKVTSPAARGLNSGAPWDYEAISQRNAEALARGGR